MEKHKCKLCARTFSNGRALGGHMKGHLATHPLPPKKTTMTTTTTHHHHHQQQQQLGRDRTETASSSSSSSGEEQGEEEEEKRREVVAIEEKSLAYGLRENPKKSFRFADPEFSFAVDSGSVVQDRESETESRNPTRRRSKRNRTTKTATPTPTPTNDDIKKPRLLLVTKPSLVEQSPPPTEPEPVSSVSDTSPEEDVAMCLMMMSRDNAWKGNNNNNNNNVVVVEQKSVDQLVSLEGESDDKEIELKTNPKTNPKSGIPHELSKKIRVKHRCGKCKKLFRSLHSLDEHKKVCFEAKNAGKVASSAASASVSVFECPFCYRVFGSGQALGGHKRSHLLAAAASSSNASAAATVSTKFNNNLIDLNMPAPLEDHDEFSVVSDA